MQTDEDRTKSILTDDRTVTGLDGITRRIVYDAEGCVVSRTEQPQTTEQPVPVEYRSELF
jgi:hypothetical protein